jgi:hypothetical protein
MGKRIAVQDALRLKIGVVEWWLIRAGVGPGVQIESRPVLFFRRPSFLRRLVDFQSDGIGKW